MMFPAPSRVRTNASRLLLASPTILSLSIQSPGDRPSSKGFAARSSLTMASNGNLSLFLNMKNKGDMDKLLTAFRGAAANWPFLLVAAGCFFICLFLCTARWQLILGAQGLDLPFKKVFRLFFIGQFFNSFMPGATSGDLFKAYFVAKETQHSKTEAVSTVFIDRVIGLLALVCLATSVMLIRLPFFLSNPKTRIALVFITAVFLGTVIGLSVVFGQERLARWKLFKRFEDNTAVGQIIGRAYRAFHTCLSHPSVLKKTIMLSLLNHLGLVITCFNIGIALGLDLPMLACLSLFPVINAVAAIPVTPGGLGTREAAAIYFLGVVGVPEAAAFSLSLLLYGTILTWSLVGGMIYLRYAFSMGRPGLMREVAEDEARQ